ncbi:MAG TPA: hypothetical protein VJ974_00835 [Geopsychrobacteraceae bacterium]|nr:hypothetical protein [Geopsychrobacteraceae bacterium]
MTAIIVHLLLLIGFHGRERTRAPEDLRYRSERSGSASLWLIALQLICSGTPVTVVGLRHGFRDFTSLLFLFSPSG